MRLGGFGKSKKIHGAAVNGKIWKDITKSYVNDIFFPAISISRHNFSDRVGESNHLSPAKYWRCVTHETWHATLSRDGPRGGEARDTWQHCVQCNEQCILQTFNGLLFYLKFCIAFSTTKQTANRINHSIVVTHYIHLGSH